MFRRLIAACKTPHQPRPTSHGQSPTHRPNQRGLLASIVAALGLSLAGLFTLWKNTAPAQLSPPPAGKLDSFGRSCGRSPRRSDLQRRPQPPTVASAPAATKPPTSRQGSFPVGGWGCRSYLLRRAESLRYHNGASFGQSAAGLLGMCKFCVSRGSFSRNLV